MIRVVVAVLLALVLLSVAAPAVEEAAAYRSERTVESAVAAIDEAATDLLAREELPPPGHAGARRSVAVDLPADGRTTRPVRYIEIERVGDRSVARYAVEGGQRRTAVIDAPIVGADNGTVELRGRGRTATVVLTLQRDGSGDPVIVFRSGWTDREADDPVRL